MSPGVVAQRPRVGCACLGLRAGVLLEILLPFRALIFTPGIDLTVSDCQFWKYHPFSYVQRSLAAGVQISPQTIFFLTAVAARRDIAWASAFLISDRTPWSAFASKLRLHKFPRPRIFIRGTGVAQPGTQTQSRSVAQGILRLCLARAQSHGHIEKRAFQACEHLIDLIRF